jgi:hypothetical protein
MKHILPLAILWTARCATHSHGQGISLTIPLRDHVSRKHVPLRQLPAQRATPVRAFVNQAASRVILYSTALMDARRRRIVMLRGSILPHQASDLLIPLRVGGLALPGVNQSALCYQDSPTAGNAQCTYDCVNVTTLNGSSFYPLVSWFGLVLQCPLLNVLNEGLLFFHSQRH